MKNTFNGFKKDHNIVFLCRNTDPLEFTLELLKLVSKKPARVLYVSVNKSYPILAEKLKKEKIDFSKWFFIDCLSSSMLIAGAPSPQCLYLSSPKSLVDLAMAIDEKMASADLIILDSVSGLLSYNDYVPSLQLLNTLMAKVRQTKQRAIYLLSYDAKKEVMEDLSLFADKVEVV